MLKGGAGEPDVQYCVDFIYQPVLETDGKVSGIFCVGSDTTQRVQAHQALQDADRRKDEFLAMLAHELRNPLAPISTAAQLLKLTAGDEQRVLQASTIISRQIAHMTSLVDDLPDVSRITRGLITLDTEVLDFTSVVAHAVEQARPAIEARRHGLTVRTAASGLLVHGDRTRLVQVIVNLLNNAAKYTPDAGEIGLVTQVVDGQAVVTVSDNGIGIDPSLIGHVFERFTQGVRSPDRVHGGLGLELALVKSLAELHGGHLAARSGGIDQGSTFTVTLPLAPQPANELPQQRPGATARTVSRRIMVVDDNVDAANTLATLLAMDGHHVSVQPGAAPASAAAALDPPEVFILDIGLPGMDGYQLAGHLRAQPEHAGAVFIALTGYGQPGDRAKSRAAGFAHHFVKPVDPQSLFDVLSAPDLPTPAAPPG